MYGGDSIGSAVGESVAAVRKEISYVLFPYVLQSRLCLGNDMFGYTQNTSGCRLGKSMDGI